MNPLCLHYSGFTLLLFTEILLLMKKYTQKALRRYDEMLSITQDELKGQESLFIRFYELNWLPHLPRDKNASILDLGRGFGLFLKFLRSREYTSISGIDLCQANVDTCKETGLSVTLGDNVPYLKEHQNEFDCISLNHILEHYDKEGGLEFLETVHSALRRDGVAIVVCPNMGNPLTAGRGRYYDLTHETGYTEDSLRFILQLAGFDEISLYSIDIYCLSNPLLNAAGRFGASLMFALFRISFLINGIRSTKIFSKNLMAVAHK